MQVKVFESVDMTSALKKVKEALGPDALILSTKTIRKKGLGILGKPAVEITAAIDIPSPGNSATQKSQNITSPAVSQLNNAFLGPLTSEVQGLKDQLKSSNVTSIHEEIDELKSFMQGFSKELSDISKKLTEQHQTPMHLQVDEDGWLAPVTNELTRRGIKAEAAKSIIQMAGEKLSPQQVGSPNVLDVFFEETIAGLLQVNSTILLENTQQKRVALVGPTGVGKTTTIAKLAAAYLKNFGRKLALVTIDTYRIAAVEQLKVYGEIMNVPVEVVMEPEKLQEIFTRHQDKKLILIDTAGRSPKDENSLKELKKFLRPDLGIENHLVLSATTKEQELYETVKRFRNLSLKSFIFTKLDECESLGSLLNLHTRGNYPLSYITNGQKVPEDLILADPKRIACLIMGRPYNRRSAHATII